MRLHSLLAAILLTGSLAGLYSGCQLGQYKAASAPAAKKYLRVTFDGQTREYTQVALGIGRLGASNMYEISASSPTGDLSLAVLGTAAGTFPYRSRPSQHVAVSQVEYKTGGTVFNSYQAPARPAAAHCPATAGQVVVTEYVPGKLVRGTFSGTLLDANDPSHHGQQGKAFSGEFYVAQS